MGAAITSLEDSETPGEANIPIELIAGEPLWRRLHRILLMVWNEEEMLLRTT